MILSKFLNSFFQYGSIYILSFSVVRLGILSPLNWKDDLGIPYKKKYSKEWNNFQITRNKFGFRKFYKVLFT